MGTLMILIIAMGFAMFLGVIFLTPRILLRPLLKERLWSLRDEAYDARRRGDFPFENKAIAVLIWRIEASILVIDEFTPSRIVTVLWLSRRMSDEDRRKIKALSEPDLSGLDDKQVEQYRAINRRFSIVASSMPVLGSWTGIVAFVVLAPIIVIVGGAASVFSSRAEKRTISALSEQRLRVEGVAYELSQESIGSRHRPHLIRA